MTTEVEQPGECESCGWATPDLRYYPTPPIGERPLGWWFCEVCATTMTSNAAIYPEQYERSGDVMRMVAWCTNRVLAEVRAQAASAPSSRPRR